ncbi:GNAT family N-acetyltransferase [Candidatus Stoquefichus massiliensis]|uniref:GNAT family N-acetyltransferase n=1 Tax=Candidatus Stoquefichus massiliensis TaxID=1470350 RepID=UPI00047F954B|nr:GNAT family N-acetyltransferase [Candidatus Stoquefichus massiliensis]
MKFQFYNQLHDDAKMIRQKVFIEEQGFENEFDEIDHDCLHLVIYDKEQPVGCARMFDENGIMMLGRIAVLKEVRQQHLGSYILQVLEDKAKALGYHEVALSAQLRASNFYKKNGYQAYGDEYLDEYCPHVHMKKTLINEDLSVYHICK